MTTRVLQVVTDPDRRGAQVFAVDLGSYIAAQGLEIETVALAPGTSATQLDVRRLSTSNGPFGFVGALRERMRSADVVIAHGSHTLMATAVASPGVSTPIIYRQISDLNFWAGSIPRRFRVRAYLRRMSHAVALWSGSAHVLTHRFGVPEDRISVVPNAANPDAFTPATLEERAVARDRFGLDSRAPVVLCVSALVQEKGIDLAIEAVGRVPGARLLVVGHGHDERALQALAARVCAERVVFAGALQDVRSAYCAADLFLLPSRTESMPAVIIEAGLSGLPVIGTRVGAIPTMIKDGETGFLVHTDAAEIADRIRTALSLPSLGTAGRTHCLRSYVIDRVGESWLRVLDEQLRARATTRTAR